MLDMILQEARRPGARREEEAHRAAVFWFNKNCAEGTVVAILGQDTSEAPRHAQAHAAGR